MPLGVDSRGPRPDMTATLERGTILVLYTDGLVESRGLSIDEGMMRLKAAVEAGPSEVDALLDHVVAALVGPMVEDDVALLACQFQPPPRRLDLRFRAEPKELAPVRRALSMWLRSLNATQEEAYDVVLACGEACANAIEHAYGPLEAFIEVEARLDDQTITVTVRDFGVWRPSRANHRGRGFMLMEGLMDEVDVRRRNNGTEVRLIRALRGPASA